MQRMPVSLLNLRNQRPLTSRRPPPGLHYGFKYWVVPLISTRISGYSQIIQLSIPCTIINQMYDLDIFKSCSKSKVSQITYLLVIGTHLSRIWHNTPLAQYKDCHSRYRDLHYENKMVVGLYYLHNGKSNADKAPLFWHAPLRRWRYRAYCNILANSRSNAIEVTVEDR